MRRTPRFFAALAVLSILAAPAQALDLDVLDDRGGKLFDALLLRPIGTLQLVLGGFGMVAYPIVYWSGQADDMTERLVTQPAEWLFERPLGEF